MKFYDTHFDEYLEKIEKYNLHEKYKQYYNNFPESLSKMKNLIFYGPAGIGKYSQMLYYIKKYSPSKLKYEKKICITYNKTPYYFMVSDIHVEIDLSLLGCISKLLWNEIYNQLVDIASSNMNNICIITCKNFHDIHSELLENFYSYMQTPVTQSIHFKYILLTEHISFIPNNIINICKVLHFPRPSKSAYVKLCKNYKNTDTNEVVNIKQGYKNIHNIQLAYKNICNKILLKMYDAKSLDYLKFRDNLYDIFIYQLNIYQCVWYIVKTLIDKNKIKKNFIPEILIEMFSFFQYYNNNYRPIYHLEHFIFLLMDHIN